MTLLFRRFPRRFNANGGEYPKTLPAVVATAAIHVEMGGIEPPSDVALSGLLRAQSAADFLGPSHHADKWLIRTQPSKSPEHPNGESVQQWPSK